MLAGVHAGRERRPRGWRFRRVGRRQRTHAAAALRQLLHVRQLAFVHPLLDELRIHAVETEDHELLPKLFRRAPRAARDRGAEANDKQGEQEAFHRMSGKREIITFDGMEGRVLAVDVGARRVGLAISDASCTLARPLETIAVTSDADAVDRVARRIHRARRRGRRARHDRRRDADAARRHAVAADLARGARSSSGSRRGPSLTIATEGERLSSREAESRLAVHERDWRKRKKKLDAAAAAVILQDYLDRAQRTCRARRVRET